MKKKPIQKIEDNLSFYSIEASEPVTNTRRNLSAIIERTDRFKNIDDGLVPFRYNGNYTTKGSSSVDVRDAVILCQKCYYNFSIFRNVIDLMTEFSIGELSLNGGSKKSRDFFNAFFKKINIWDVQDRIYREYYRSGNVFIQRFESKIQPSDVTKIMQVYGEIESVSGDLMLPISYVVLNPGDIQMTGTANFSYGIYYKLLTDFELARLKFPQTDQDRELLESLPDSVKKQIASGNRAILLQLDPTKTSMFFYKKQDYEPFSVPMGYPVLESINAKAEMMKMDMALARTMQQMVLLVTTGNEPEKHGINPKSLEALRKLFTNQSVGRVLVADYSTDAKFVIPDIAELLNPQKYEILERDINVGLNNVFAGGEKFANQAQKVDIFVARLEQGRQAFLNNFLIPEIKRIAKAVGLKNYPTPHFKDIELKDSTVYAKIYARLIELGVLTPEQGIKAINTNIPPDFSTMVEEQEEYKAQRDKGLYQPLIGAGLQDEAGRPVGVNQAPKKVTPIGKGSEQYSLTKIKDNLLLAQDLEKEVTSSIKAKHNVKKVSRLQKEVISQITNIILANEEPENWIKSVISYIENPEDRNKDRLNRVTEIAASHSLDYYLASILLASSDVKAL